MRIRNTGRHYTNGMGLTLATGAEAEVDVVLGARLLRDYPGQIVEVPGPPPTPALSGHAPVGAEGGAMDAAAERSLLASAAYPASEPRDASLTTGSTSARTNEQPGSEPASRDSGGAAQPGAESPTGDPGRSADAPDDRRAHPREVPGIAPLEHEMPPRKRRGKSR